MKLSKKDWLKFFVIIILLSAISFIVGLDLIFALPLIVCCIILYYFDKSTVKQQSKTKIVITLIFLLFVIFGKSVIGFIFKDSTNEVCGILTKNDFEFFDRFTFNSPNTLIQKDTQTLEFRSFVTNTPLNSKVCITYIESDTNIWFYDDYVLDIQEIKN